MYVKKLNSVKDLSGIGNKCSNLALLAEHGFNVPKASGVIFEAYERFFSPLSGIVGAIIQSNDYKSACEKIRELMTNSDMPQDVVASIQEFISGFPNDTMFAVRSSGVALQNGTAVVEDSANKSLAGQYESFLNVPTEEVATAVKHCWASLFNERSLHAFEAKSNPNFLQSKMSVVIQQMILADISAVVMTKDPIEKQEVLAMEATYGPCEAIVSGKVTGDLIAINRNTMMVSKRELGSKRNKVVYDIFNGVNRGNYSLVANADYLQKRLSVDDETALRIAKVGLDIEERFGHPQDIELVMAKQEIYVVQTRNITTSIHGPLN